MKKGLLKLAAVCLLLAGMVACDGGSSIKGVWLATNAEEWNGTSYVSVLENPEEMKMYIAFSDVQYMQYMEIISPARAEVAAGIFTCPSIYWDYVIEGNSIAVYSKGELITTLTYELSGKNLHMEMPDRDYEDYPRKIDLVKVSSDTVADAVEDCGIFDL